MQKTIVTLREAIDEAAKQEKLLKNKNELKGRIAVLADMEDEELEDQELDEDTVNKINNTRARQGKQPYRRFNNFKGNKQQGQGVRSGSNNGNKNGNQQNKEDWKCRYCNAPGHMQAEKENQPELLCLTGTANLSEETTKEFAKLLTQKKPTTCWDTSNNHRDKVVVLSRTRII